MEKGQVDVESIGRELCVPVCARLRVSVCVFRYSLLLNWPLSFCTVHSVLSVSVY